MKATSLSTLSRPHRCGGIRHLQAPEPGRLEREPAHVLPGGQPPRRRRHLVRDARPSAAALRPRSAIRPVIIMALTGVLGVGLYKALKHVFVRERPFITHTSISLATAPLDRYSFPSGHTLHAVSFTWQAVAYFPELAWVLVPLAALIAASRVVLGLHYPTDVLAGAAIGARSRTLGLCRCV